MQNKAKQSNALSKQTQQTKAKQSNAKHSIATTRPYITCADLLLACPFCCLLAWSSLACLQACYSPACLLACCEQAICLLAPKQCEATRSKWTQSKQTQSNAEQHKQNNATQCTTMQNKTQQKEMPRFHPMRQRFDFFVPLIESVVS